MTDPEIRPEVVDLLAGQFEYGVTHTPRDQALIETATDAEWHAVEEIRAAEFAGEWRLITGQATEEEEQLWAMMPGPPIFEGLPPTAAAVLTAMSRWPWDRATRDLILPVMARWSAADRMLLEERFRAVLRNVFSGVHWVG